MPISRSIARFDTKGLAAIGRFYEDVIGLQGDMAEAPGFLMLRSETTSSARMIVNENGYPGPPPGFVIDVGTLGQLARVYDDVRECGLVIVETLMDKPWGIRRFLVLGPNGACITIQEGQDGRGDEMIAGSQLYRPDGSPSESRVSDAIALAGISTRQTIRSNHPVTSMNRSRARAASALSRNNARFSPVETRVKA